MGRGRPRKLGDEGLVVASVAGKGALEGARGGWEVGGHGLARHVGIARAIKRDRVAVVKCGASQVRGVESTSAGVAGPYEAVIAAATVSTLIGVGGGGEVGGGRLAGHKGVAQAVDCDAETDVK